MFHLLKKRSLWMPLVISIVMHLSQQLSGINAVCSVYLIKSMLNFKNFRKKKPNVCKQLLQQVMRVE